MSISLSQEQQREYERNIFRASLFKFLTFFYFFAAVLVPFYTEWGGLTFSQVMLLQVSYTMAVFFMEIPTGVIADRWGRRSSLLLGAIALVLAVTIYSLYPNFWIFLGAELVWGLGTALISGADQAMLYDSLKMLGRERESKKILGRWMGMGMLALTIAAPLGSLIAHYLGLRATMIASIVPLCLASAVAITFVDPPAMEKKPSLTYVAMMGDGLKYLKEHAILRCLVFDFTTVTVLGFLIIWFHQMVMQRAEIPIFWFGWITATMTMGQIVVLNNFALFDRICKGKLRHTFYTGLLMGGSYLIMAASDNIVLLLISIIICGVLGPPRRTLMQNYMNKYIDSNQRATVLSAASMLYSLSYGIFSLLSSVMISWSFSGTLAIIGGLIFICAAISRLEEAHLID